MPTLRGRPRLPVGAVYRDIYSGAVLHERPQFRELRKAARDRAIDVVISYALDRLSRNQAHLYIVAEELESAGIRVEFVTESFEDSAVGKFIRSAKSFAAEVEREKFIERSVRGKRARVGAGKLLHGKTPLYGYDWADGTKSRYVVNPITAPIARRIFDASMSGASIRAIAAMLTADRIPTSRGAAQWDPVVVRNILRNSAYAGEAYAFRVQQTKVAGTNRTRSTERPRNEWVPLPEGRSQPSWIRPHSTSYRIGSVVTWSSRRAGCTIRSCTYSVAGTPAVATAGMR